MFFAPLLRRSGKNTGYAGVHMNKNEQKVHDDIKKYGCHIIGVMESEDFPRISYSIGIEETLSAPEIVIVGLKTEVAQSVINDYYSRVKNGESFEGGKKYLGFLEGFEVCFKIVTQKNIKEHMCWADWYYNRKSFRALQLVYPSTSGVWPWDKEANEAFLWWQRLLCESETKV